ncbi:MAG TPA: gluconeogenesis factor YvcK family protein, partial [Vicinamibacterales bacterium]|nr:gluconeogenesis factor YvcK family protein [Vicinamibacterales bacterium]
MIHEVSRGRISPASSASYIEAARHAAAPHAFPRIVALGGGTGLPVVLRGLATALQADAGDVTPWRDWLTAIVTVTDDGGSSGRLRQELGMLPPGDVRNCLAALSPDAAFAQLLSHRFDARTNLDGHPVGNLLLAALTQMTGSFTQAIDQMAALLKTCGRVFPSTIEDVALRAELANGEIVDGETAIVGHWARVRRLQLARPVRPWPDALRAIINADLVVVGPGSLYTSVLPNLLIDGVASTL